MPDSARHGTSTSSTTWCWPFRGRGRGRPPVILPPALLPVRRWGSMPHALYPYRRTHAAWQGIAGQGQVLRFVQVNPNIQLDEKSPSRQLGWAEREPSMPTSTLAMDRLLNRALALLDDSRHPGIMGHGHSMAMAWVWAWAEGPEGMGHGMCALYVQYSTHHCHPNPSRHRSQSQDDSNGPPPSRQPRQPNPGRRAPPGRVGVELRFFRRP
ncbi:hypothetical protein F5883DRAFT_69323 [Diaporthe sp. PMI_573]|nr:hypothetical protein F5883DRAFT_69323 [Diaporthaceae sp. PMI_573]